MEHKQAVLTADRICKAYMNYLKIVEAFQANPAVFGFVISAKGAAAPDFEALDENRLQARKGIDLFIWNLEFEGKISEQQLGKARFKMAQKLITHPAIDINDKVKQIWSIIYENKSLV